MIYANDLWVQFPIKDLYDSNMMLASVLAAKDMYEKGLLEIKDFKKEYGDFLSPNRKDMDWYQQNVIGKVKDVINYLYAHGIDPLRSAEGRAAVSRVINSIDTGKVNEMKLTAEARKQYNAAAVKLGDKYNKEYTDWWFKKNYGTTPDEWNTDENGVFPVAAPPAFQSLLDLTYNSYKGRTARMLTLLDFNDDPRLKNYKFDPNYQYIGYLDSDLMKVAPGASLSLVGNPNADFFREKAAAKVIASGIEPTAQNIEDQFLRDIADANSWALIDPAREADPFALDNARTANDIYAHSKNRATDHSYWELEHLDDDDDTTPNIFRRAEKLADATEKGSKTKGIVGEHTQYQMSEQYYQQIDPVVQAGMTLAKDKNTGETVPQYTFRRQDLRKSGSFGYLGEDGKMHDLKLTNASEEGNYVFIGNGNMRASRIGTYKDGTPRYKYWISGTLKNQNGVVKYNGSNVLWIPVKERDHNYGLTQKKK